MGKQCQASGFWDPGDAAGDARGGGWSGFLTAGGLYKGGRYWLIMLLWMRVGYG